MNDPKTIYVAYADDARGGFPQTMADFVTECDPNINFYIMAKDGLELLEKIAKVTVQPDVCILDVRMPNMDGYATAMQLRKKYPHTRVLGISVFDERAAILQMFRHGARGFISKGDWAEEIATGIRDVYELGYYLRSKIVQRTFPKLTEDNLKKHCKATCSEVELQYMRLCCTYLRTEDIAEKIGLSERTVEAYPARLCKKLGLPESPHPQQNLALLAYRCGLEPFE